MSKNNCFSPEVRRLVVSWFLNEFETITEWFEIAKKLITQKLNKIKNDWKWLDILSLDQLTQMLLWTENWEVYEWWAMAFQLMQYWMVSSSDIQAIYIYMQHEDLLKDRQLISDLRDNLDLLDKQSLEVKTKIKLILDME